MLAILTGCTDYGYFKLFYILLLKVFSAKTPFLYQTFKNVLFFMNYEYIIETLSRLIFLH